MQNTKKCIESKRKKDHNDSIKKSIQKKYAHWKISSTIFSWLVQLLYPESERTDGWDIAEQKLRMYM